MRHGSKHEGEALENVGYVENIDDGFAHGKLVRSPPARSLVWRKAECRDEKHGEDKHLAAGHERWRANRKVEVGDVLSGGEGMSRSQDAKDGGLYQINEDYAFECH